MRRSYALAATLLLGAIGCSQSDVGEQELVTQDAVLVDQQEPDNDAGEQDPQLVVTADEVVETLDGLPEEFLGTWASWRGKSDVERQVVIRETVFVIAVRDLLTDVRERTYYSVEWVEQKAVQQAHAKTRTESQVNLVTCQNAGEYDTLRLSASQNVPPQGDEQGANSAGKTPFSGTGAAESGAVAASGRVDKELTFVVEKWAGLPPAIRNSIVTLVRAADGQTLD